MKTLRNLGVLIVYFVLFFLALSSFYFVCIVEPFNYILNGTTDELIKNAVIFFSNYIFAISILSAVVTVFVLGSLLKLSGVKSVFISIFIFAILLSLYPCYNYFLGESKKQNDNYMVNTQGVKYLDVNGFTEYDNYSVYAGSKIDYRTYKGVITIENGFNKPVYFADFVKLNSSNISLQGVKIISVNDPKVVATANLNVTPYKDKYANGFFYYMFSRITLFPYIVNLFDMYMVKTAPIYSVAVIFLALFLFLLGSYLVTAALSSPYHKYHNILTIVAASYIFFIVTALFIKIFNISPSDINTSRFLFISIIIISGGLIVNIFSIILNKLLKISSHYKS